ncbi:hypothetical protein CEXT_44521 [Caerostris extrusa]|uniref:Uncharacterized protein n=1 Tax=Caerostris extrusa TaxID=172846 RepID=A0AAV4Y5U8_CAEEX|nr:hypothetical protein CEXT_44521 [Caerostris extrusa]
MSWPVIFRAETNYDEEVPAPDAKPKKYKRNLSLEDLFFSLLFDKKPSGELTKWRSTTLCDKATSFGKGKAERMDQKVTCG